MDATRGLIDVIALIGALAIILHTQFILRDERKTQEKQEEEIRFIANAMLTVGTLIWPIVWDVTIGLDKLMEKPRLVPAFFWVPFFHLCQMQFVPQVSGEGDETSRALFIFQQKGLSEDTSQLISAAFAMGSLFLASTKNESNTENYGAAHIIMYGLIMCLAFVVPTLHVPPETRTAVLWRSAQFVMLNYAIAFVIAGISANLLPLPKNGG
ncbi:MAG: hypothetical protein K0U52_12760 [Gammaproteobacteria bacterium]|nr:hypothetical protein [Gammaproteobacteria bacterium]